MMRPTCLTLAMIFLGGCATSTYQVNQFHQDNKVRSAHLKAKTLFIAPLLLEVTSVSNTSPKVDSGKEARYLNKDSLAMIFNRSLVSKFDRSYDQVTVIQQMPEYNRYNDVVRAKDLQESVNFFGKGKAEYYFKHPKKEVLENLGVRADLVLFISSLTVSIKDVDAADLKYGGGGAGTWVTTTSGGGPGKAPMVTQTMMPGGGFTTATKKVPRLSAFAKYIIWDYAQGAAIAYGQFQIEDGVDGNRIKTRWVEIQDGVVQRITAHSAKL